MRRLNSAGLGLDLLPNRESLSLERVMERVRFVTYNDTRNLEKNLAQQFNALSGFENRFVVVDEAHNLFRSKGGEALDSRGNILFNLLMQYETLQLIFATGTPITSDPADLVFAFQMLTMNPRILDEASFREIFVDAQNRHSNREILVRRTYGLV